MPHSKDETSYQTQNQDVSSLAYKAFVKQPYTGNKTADGQASWKVCQKMWTGPLDTMLLT